MKILIFILICFTWVIADKRDKDDKGGTATRVYFTITEKQAQSEKGVKEILKVLNVKTSFDSWKQHRLSVDKTEALYEAWIEIKKYELSSMSIETQLNKLVKDGFIQAWRYWHTYSDKRKNKKDIYDLIKPEKWAKKDIGEGKKP